ncbi:MAG: proline dehydrogenase [Candidatus Rokubacteria bacterium]|nr:proline dehydrogenase [Candidatus Rokubacteria bacterium]
MTSTVCFWNGPDDSPREVARAYLASLDALARERMDCHLSIKAPALGFDRELLSEILQRAGRIGILVHFDSLGPESADRTFSLIAELLPRYPRLGCTLPGRWRRSLGDAERAVELGLRVRVVKGQWEDQDGNGIDPREGFLAVIERLAGRARHVGVATHDVPLARAALQRLSAAGTACELELLFGLPHRRPAGAAGAAGIGARFYVPYGQGCLPYHLGQARENPWTLWWFLRALALASFFRPPVALSQIREAQDALYSGKVS